MLKYFLIFIFGILLNVCLCYEIPNVKLDLLKNGFTLRIPGKFNLFDNVLKDKCLNCFC